MTTNTKRVKEINRSKKRIMTVVLVASIMLGTLSACGNGGDNKMKDGQSMTGETTVTPASEHAAMQPEELADFMLSGKHETIYKQFSTEFQAQVSQADFAAMSVSFITGVDAFRSSSSLLHNEMDIRVWLSSEGDKGILAAFGDDGEIIGLQIQDLVTYPDTDDNMTQTAFDFPFQGEWLVFWGGTNVFQNYHYELASQRYAYDLIQAKDGKSYAGDPSLNESYFAFGQEALAPADGTVVSVINDIVDNEPVGVANEKVPAGNLVVIDHGGEFSYLAHLKKGSVTVKPGDKVERGEIIGQIGNSGNSSEPHLHFQVSGGSNLFESEAINVQWNDGSQPVQGEIINAD